MNGMDHLLLNDPSDIEDMARKIGFLLADNVEREKIAIAARKIAERYTISNNAQQFVDLYQTVLERNV